MSGGCAFRRLEIWPVVISCAISLLLYCVTVLHLIHWHCGCSSVIRSVMISDMYALQHHNLQEDPTQEKVFDYGLYLIDCILQASNSNQSLHDWPMVPFPVGNWAELIGNPLIREQHYNVDEQAALAAKNIPCLNQGQHAAFDEIVKAVDEQSGKTFFLHGPGGTGKTFTYI